MIHNRYYSSDCPNEDLYFIFNFSGTVNFYIDLLKSNFSEFGKSILIIREVLTNHASPDFVNKKKRIPISTGIINHNNVPQESLKWEFVVSSKQFSIFPIIESNLKIGYVPNSFLRN